MTIKIDANRSTADAEAARQLAGRTQDRASTDRTVDRSSTRTDRVEVSRDAQLMTRALKVAGESSGIRHDVVERMRRLLDSGELGRDSSQLADALIDHMINR